MLRTTDKRLFVGQGVPTVFGRGKLARVPYPPLPPIVPTLAWYDSAAWVINKDYPLASRLTLKVNSWLDRNGSFPAPTGGGTITMDDTIHDLFPVTTFPASGENFVQISTMSQARPFSILAAGQVTNVTAPRSIFGSGNGGGFAWRLNTSGQLEALNSGVAVRAATAFSVTNGVPFAAACVVDTATGITQYLDSAAQSETDLFGGTLGINAGFGQIGADTSPAGIAPWIGWIGEVMLFSSALSSGDVGALLDYLRRKWCT